MGKGSVAISNTRTTMGLVKPCRNIKTVTPSGTTRRRTNGRLDEHEAVYKIKGTDEDLMLAGRAKTTQKKIGDAKTIMAATKQLEDYTSWPDWHKVILVATICTVEAQSCI